MTRRFRHCWLILIGRIPIEYSTERMEFDMALDNFNTAVTNLQSAANALVAKSANDATALASAQTELASVDAQATAAIQPITDALNNAVNPPSPPTA